MFKFYRIHLKTRDVISTGRWYMERLSAKKLEEYESDGNRNILLDVDGTEIIITQPSDSSSLPAAPAGPWKSRPWSWDEVNLCLVFWLFSGSIEISRWSASLTKHKFTSSPSRS